MSNLFDTHYVKTKLRDEFNLTPTTIKLIGGGYDSEAYLVDNNYVFKFAKHSYAVQDYVREKRILDFLRIYLKTNVKIPVIEYFKKTDDCAIMGYKVIEGTILSPEVYKKMNLMQKENLVKSLSNFLNELHNLNTEEISEYIRDSKSYYEDDFNFMKKNVYSLLNSKEINLVESVFNLVFKNNKIFNGKKCLIHNDLSANHIILNDNYELEGIIDFGDACITDECFDFQYLLEESDEEIGRDFGLKVLEHYGYKDVQMALDFAEFKDKYYPIEIIIWGIKYNNKELLNEGLDILKELAN